MVKQGFLEELGLSWEKGRGRDIPGLRQCTVNNPRSCQGEGYLWSNNLYLCGDAEDVRVLEWFSRLPTTLTSVSPSHHLDESDPKNLGKAKNDY